MTIDATFWVMISFFAFVGLLIYFKIPQKIKSTLEENINNIWEYCYNNLKIELKKYLYDNINKNEIFRYFDISSTIIDM